MERDIDATTTVRAGVDAVRQVVTDDPGLLFCEVVEPEDRERRSFATRITASIGSGSALEQDVWVDVGDITTEGDTVIAPLRWSPAGRERLLPGFDGRLEVAPDDGARTVLTLRGSYRVPLGPIGRFGDSVVGARVARHSLTEFLRRIAGRLDAAAAEPPDSEDSEASTYTIDVREYTKSDNFFG